MSNKIEEKLLKEEEKIEKLEEQILKSETKISENLSSGIKTLSKDGLTSSEASIIKRSVLRKIAKHKFIFTLLTTVAVVLVWKSVWNISDTLPILESSIGSLVVGLVMLWLIEKYTEL